MGLQKYRADEAGETGLNGATPYYARWIGGPTLALVRNCPCGNADLPARTVYITGEPETWSSLPAACSYKGKRITGYVMTDENGYVFRAHTEQALLAGKYLEK